MGGDLNSYEGNKGQEQPLPHHERKTREDRGAIKDFCSEILSVICIDKRFGAISEFSPPSIALSRVKRNGTIREKSN